mmetsp:Transcript_138912/g.241553  ORF Transcript_138912/g.241553 Transcript_138912/m.241553 type:complete len:448 (-) Transcript_138912:566-1909(-)
MCSTCPSHVPDPNHESDRGPALARNVAPGPNPGTSPPTSGNFDLGPPPCPGLDSNPNPGPDFSSDPAGDPCPSPDPDPKLEVGPSLVPGLQSLPKLDPESAGGEEGVTEEWLRAHDFEEWVQKEMYASPLYFSEYRPLIERAAAVVCTLRERFIIQERSLWLRLMKNGRMLKELNEIIPVVARVLAHVDSTDTAKDGPITVLDLCSGVGYMSVLLAELLRDSPKIARFVLVDHQFPLLGRPTEPHHINPDHLLKQDLFPHELTYRKYDLKKSNGHRCLQAHVIERAPGPVIVLGVHLCGLLSIRAVQTFNDNPRCSFMALKPCCLPPPWPGRRPDERVWTLGGHRIVARDVCARGSYNKNQWSGPPKAYLRPTFQRWAADLFRCLDVEPAGTKDMADVKLLHDNAHYQTLFVFAQRPYCAAAGIISDIGGEADRGLAVRAEGSGEAG